MEQSAFTSIASQQSLTHAQCDQSYATTTSTLSSLQTTTRMTTDHPTPVPPDDVGHALSLPDGHEPMHGSMLKCSKRKSDLEPLNISRRNLQKTSDDISNHYRESTHASQKNLACIFQQLHNELIPCRALSSPKLEEAIPLPLQVNPSFMISTSTLRSVKSVSSQNSLYTRKYRAANRISEVLNIMHNAILIEAAKETASIGNHERNDRSVPMLACSTCSFFHTSKWCSPLHVARESMKSRKIVNWPETVLHALESVISMHRKCVCCSLNTRGWPIEWAFICLPTHAPDTAHDLADIPLTELIPLDPSQFLLE